MNMEASKSQAPTGTHIEAKQFSIFYGAQEAVKRVDMKIPQGQVTAIIGPRGAARAPSCGQSTG